MQFQQARLTSRGRSPPMPLHVPGSLARLGGVWHHSCAHDFFARAVWCPDRLGVRLVDFIVAVFVKPDAPVVVTVDDTLFGRCGRRVADCFYHHRLAVGRAVQAYALGQRLGRARARGRVSFPRPSASSGMPSTASTPTTSRPAAPPRNGTTPNRPPAPSTSWPPCAARSSARNLSPQHPVVPHTIRSRPPSYHSRRPSANPRKSRYHPEKRYDDGKDNNAGMGVQAVPRSSSPLRATIAPRGTHAPTASRAEWSENALDEGFCRGPVLLESGLDLVGREEEPPLLDGGGA